MYCTFRNSVTRRKQRYFSFTKKKKNRQRTNLRNTVERARNNCCQWNATIIPSLFIVYELHVSFCSLPYDRSTVSSTASSPQCYLMLLIQFPVSSFVLHVIRSSLRLLPRLRATSILTFIFPSTSCFSKQWLRNTWPIQIAFYPFIACRIFLSSLTLCNTFQYLSHCRISKIIYVSVKISTSSSFVHPVGMPLWYDSI